MKKLIALLLIVAVLMAVCAGCAHTEETSGNVDTPETVAGEQTGDTPSADDGDNSMIDFDDLLSNS